MWTGLEVRAALARNGKTQDDLAAHLGLSQTAVHRRVTGRVPFNVNELAQVAAFFGIDVRTLVRSDAA